MEGYFGDVVAHSLLDWNLLVLHDLSEVEATED